jgi:pimeloyl-ACP methyl ester carboxylesterase
MSLHLFGASRVLLLFTVLGAITIRAGSAETPETSSISRWTLDFKQNTILPPWIRQFSNPRGDRTIQTGFLVDHNNGLTKRKPLMIIIDGSGAQSQFFLTPDGGRGTTTFGAIGRRIADEYHVASCEKRGIETGYIGAKPGAATGAPLEYHRHATFEGRVAEVRLLLDRLLRESMVDPLRVVLMGNSEGADVAAGVAAEDARVTHLAFLAGGGPTQLFDFFICRRKKMQKEGSAPEQIVESLQKIEEEFRNIFSDPESDTKMYLGHAYRRWTSFCSHPPIESLLKTKAKLFLANGTEDSSVPIESFDLLVAEMIRHGRANVIMRRYPGSDHGLSHPGAKGPLEDVLDDVLKWAHE